MRKKLLRLLLVVALLLTSLCALADEKRGFDTPEACAQAVYDALKAQDVAALDNCFAFAELARQFDFNAFCERIQAVMAAISLLPATGPINIAYNESKLRRDFLFRLSFSTLMLNRPELAETVGNGLVIGKTQEDYNDVLLMMNEASSMECWSTFTLVKIVTPAYFPELSKNFYSERNLSNIQKMLLPWGVSEYEELILILGLPASSEASGMGLLVMPLQIIKVNGRWLANPNNSVVASILGINAMSLVAPLAE